MSLNGDIKRAFNLNYNTANIFMNVGSHAGFYFNDHFYFGAISDGFKTKFNYVEPSNDE